jgi:hypothetical protein
MTCCGQKRQAPGLTNPSGPSAAKNGPWNQGLSGPSAGTATRASQFEYRGGRMLTVIGQATGYQYRFVGYGARLSVDARDRASLAVVPELREIRS